MTRIKRSQSRPSPSFIDADLGGQLNASNRNNSITPSNSKSKSSVSHIPTLVLSPRQSASPRQSTRQSPRQSASTRQSPRQSASHSQTASRIPFTSSHLQSSTLSEYTNTISFLNKYLLKKRYTNNSSTYLYRNFLDAIDNYEEGPTDYFNNCKKFINEYTLIETVKSIDTIITQHVNDYIDKLADPLYDYYIMYQPWTTPRTRAEVINTGTLADIYNIHITNEKYKEIYYPYKDKLENTIKAMQKLHKENKHRIANEAENRTRIKNTLNEEIQTIIELINRQINEINSIKENEIQELTKLNTEINLTFRSYNNEYIKTIINQIEQSQQNITINNIINSLILCGITQTNGECLDYYSSLDINNIKRKIPIHYDKMYEELNSYITWYNLDNETHNYKTRDITIVTSTIQDISYRSERGCLLVSDSTLSEVITELEELIIELTKIKTRISEIKTTISEMNTNITNPRDSYDEFKKYITTDEKQNTLYNQQNILKNKIEYYIMSPSIKESIFGKYLKKSNSLLSSNIKLKADNIQAYIHSKTNIFKEFIDSNNSNNNNSLINNTILYLIIYVKYKINTLIDNIYSNFFRCIITFHNTRLWRDDMIKWYFFISVLSRILTIYEDKDLGTLCIDNITITYDQIINHNIGNIINRGVNVNYTIGVLSYGG